jgi:hypothetical protein
LGPGEDLFLIVLFIVLLFAVVSDFAELAGFGDLLRP